MNEEKIDIWFQKHFTITLLRAQELVGIYALVLTRAWQLLGGRSRQLNDWLTPLRDTEDRHSVTDTDQSLAASSARNDEPG
jgi:hypothetical protein